MAKRRADEIKTFLIVTVLVIIVRQVDLLPWWAFVVPVLLFGALIGYPGWKVRSFPIGFLSGFLIWLTSGILFNSIHNGIMLKRLSVLSGAPGIVLLLISALIGGVLTGLALYTGKNLFKPALNYNLE
jgi:hypothetical protein